MMLAPSWTERVTLPAVPAVGDAAPQLSAFKDQLPVLAAMEACEQDPVHHAEGNVLIHTQMVCDQLVAHPVWKTLDPQAREELWWAAVLHDCGKPQTTRMEDGRLRSPGHATAGAVLARRLLWQAGVAPARRERVCGLVRWHMTPYHLLDRPDPQRTAIELSLDVRADQLAVLVESDARGRAAADGDRLVDELQLFSVFCDELGCLTGPYPFASDHARVSFFRREDRDPSWAAFDDSRCELTVLSGLPGAGKDFWAGAHADGRKVISLDDLRRERKVRRGDQKAQGQMIAAARELLRDELRHGRDVIWNATNLSRQQRAPVLGLAADYNARVRVICVEADPARLRTQNRDRPHPVKEAAIEDMLRRWEFPSLADAHAVQTVS